VQVGLSALTVVLASGIAVGMILWFATLVAAFFFRNRRIPTSGVLDTLPPVTILKPVCGLEKNLAENLRTACEQDYPTYQVVYSAQRQDDPAIDVLRELEREFGPERVSVVVSDVQVGENGKINNLAGALPSARHDILVISDSDVRLRPDYLKAIVSPLADPSIGGVSTYFKASDAGPWYEQMEMLTINADHFASLMFADVIGVSDFCFGASFALRRETLERIGGLECLGSYLVEDNEMGQRILRTGLKLVVVPHVVETTIDLESPTRWWQKMIYWDQNTRAAKPGIFAASLVLRIIPLGLLFAAVRSFDSIGLAVFIGAVAVRVLAAAAVLGVALRDYRSLRSLWLIPFKDVLSLFWFAHAYVNRTVVWRGARLGLTRDGRFIPATPPS
jgi:ceramide glucosyltransferase